MSTADARCPDTAAKLENLGRPGRGCGPRTRRRGCRDITQIGCTATGKIERSFGRILYVSWVAAPNGGIVGPHYAASKAALHGPMHHLAARVAGVTVNTIAPALILGFRNLPGDAGDGELPISIPCSPTPT